MPAELTAVLTSMFAGADGVTVEQKANHVSLLVGKRVFAYTKADAVILKLPRAAIEELIAAGSAAPLTMGKSRINGWCVLRHDAPEQYRDDLDLLRQAMAFVRDGS